MVAGQLMAFSTMSCDMQLPEASEVKTSSVMDHSMHQDMDDTNSKQPMPCCDMSANCDMMSCHALMSNYYGTHSLVTIKSTLIHSLNQTILSHTLDSLYKPPILS